jgi:hypothetical protein
VDGGANVTGKAEEIEGREIPSILNEDISNFRAQRFAVDDDNDPAPKNIPSPQDQSVDGMYLPWQSEPLEPTQVNILFWATFFTFFPLTSSKPPSSQPQMNPSWILSHGKSFYDSWLFFSCWQRLKEFQGECFGQTTVRTFFLVHLFVCMNICQSTALSPS